MSDEQDGIDGRLTVHAWGFFDEAGSPRLPDGIAVTVESVFDAYRRVEANVEAPGGAIENRRATRTLDGWLVGVEFETPPREKAAHMWHVITRESDNWPTPRLRPAGGES